MVVNMNKKIIVLGLLLFTITPLFSQNFENWRFVRTIGPQISTRDVTVTPDSSIWIASSFPHSSDSRIVVLNQDGSIKKMIDSINFQGIDYTFEYLTEGINTDCDGNVLYSSFDYLEGGILYKIDYKTYECLGRIAPFSEEQDKYEITKAVSDSCGNVLVGIRPPGDFGVRQCFKTFTTNFQFIETVLSIDTYGTSFIAMNPNGTSLYIPRVSSSGGVSIFHSPNGVFGKYTFVKNIGYGKSSGAVHIDNKGRLWLGYPFSANPNYQLPPSGYDCWDLEQEEIVGGLISAAGKGDSEQGDILIPLGIAFSLDGKKAYICNSNPYKLQEWELVSTIDAEEPKAIPVGFAISQNYPNPFNPSTNFSYSVPNKANVRIAVYDIFGREIKTLLNESKDTGTYNITWDSRDNDNRQVATGIYFYKVQARGFQKTMKMMLMK
jgi:DNA-binding beta-propeller fold protein YncE